MNKFPYNIKTLKLKFYVIKTFLLFVRKALYILKSRIFDKYMTKHKFQGNFN